MKRWIALALVAMTGWLAAGNDAAAHHVLGRPAYALNEDSNTPSALQGDAHIGKYTVTYMVFPAFPKPGAAGRISLYVSAADAGTEPFNGKVSFKVGADTWLSRLGFGAETKTLGTQPPDDHVYRQGFIFGQAGDYIVTAEFQAGGEAHVLEFPLRIGEAHVLEFPLRIGAPPGIGPLGIIIGGLVIVLVTVGAVQRRRSLTGKIRAAHAQGNDPRRRSGSDENGAAHARRNDPRRRSGSDENGAAHARRNDK